VDRAAPPPNFALKITDGTTIDVPSDTVDFAFSDQLMEHLHVDDALDQLREVQRVLKPGGSYLVCTPSRLTGPHDISRFYDDVARGFHLHEYTNGELAHLMRRLRFRRVDVGIPIGGRMRTFPSLPFVLFERLCEALPEKIRQLLLRSRIVRGLLGVRIVATK
jgi:SAM-dependent methyltransferase